MRLAFLGAETSYYYRDLLRAAGRHEIVIAVGTGIAVRPPRGSVRAGLPHTALTLDVDLQTARWDTGAGFSASAASVCSAWKTWPRLSNDRVGCVVAARGATVSGSRHGIVAGVESCLAPHSIGTSRVARLATRRRPLPGRRDVSMTTSLSSRQVWLPSADSAGSGTRRCSPVSLVLWNGLTPRRRACRT